MINLTDCTLCEKKKKEKQNSKAFGRAGLSTGGERRGEERRGEERRGEEV